MMREERGKHFDPVLLDAFMEVLERSGPDAREQVRADPAAVAESALETFATALERGEAEPAESAIAQAMEDGLGAGDVQGEVIEPTLRRLADLRERGQIDAEHEQLAMTIVRRVLAMLRRYLLSGREDEDVLARIEHSVEQVEEALRSAAVG
jgi:flagellar biosynthesis/type III secretory pathway protein FliH